MAETVAEELSGAAELHGRRATVLAVVNQKGGVGKSTTAVNLSACLAEAGAQVLLIDFDPQGNATSGVGVEKAGRTSCVYNALSDGVPLLGLVEKTKVERLDAVPATLQLAGAEIELVAALSREQKLKKAISPARTAYDFIIIDCPPSLGLLTVNALTATDEVVVPVQCEYYALEGLSKLLESIRLVKTNLNPDLRIAGVLMTMYDARTRLGQQVVDEVRSFFRELVYEAVVPRTVRLSEAPSHGLPISKYDPKSKGTVAYRKLAREVMARAKKRIG
ncbi:MAG: AAA family ATPase [Chloroflexi bacterium]|nr:AAA family ATPase [Chloroflexota bacterium]